MTSNLDSVLHKYKIYPQAYRIRAFIENHCHKYLMAKVYQGICDSVVTKAEELCDHRNVAVRAQAICDKFKDLNRLFSDVHCRISHPNPVNEEETGEMQGMINICMPFYRREFPEVRVIPKQHLLESWIQRWGFGLFLHAEQGAEETHATINCPKRRVWGLWSKEQQLRVLMKEHMAIMSPLFHGLMPSSHNTKRNCMLHKCHLCLFKLECLYNSFYFRRVHCFECMGTFYCGSENKLVTHVGKNNNIDTANIVNHRHV